jgi:hypothetical protein
MQPRQLYGSGPLKVSTSLDRVKLVREPGAGSRERGVGIVVKNPKIDKFHQK